MGDKVSTLVQKCSGVEWVGKFDSVSIFLGIKGRTREEDCKEVRSQALWWNAPQTGAVFEISQNIHRSPLA